MIPQYLLIKTTYIFRIANFAAKKNDIHTMSPFGNILWIVFGGFLISLEYFVVGITLCCTIVGIPFGVQAIKLGVFAMLPFGHRAITVDMDDEYWLVSLMTLIWVIIGGVWIAITHVALGIILCVTIIGIPFGIQHFKLIPMTFSPFWRNIVRS